MEPKDIAKLITDLDYNNGVVSEQATPAQIPTGIGSFKIYFNRGTIVQAAAIAASEGKDPNLFYAGIGHGEICFKTKNPYNVPPSMVMLDDDEQAKEVFGIEIPSNKYMVPYKHMITFNAKNVLKVERA